MKQSQTEIQQNREKLIRYFLSQEDDGCAKENMADCFGIDLNKTPIGLTGRPLSDDHILTKRMLLQVGMTEAQWHEMETRYEGWGYKLTSLHELATDYLPSLPGWPRVL